VKQGGDILDKEYFSILVFGHSASKTPQLRIYKKTFQIVVYLLFFALLSTIFFFCDYIQVKKKDFELRQLHQETQAQNSQIQFFLARIENLEKQLSRLKDFDRKIRIIANLEKGQEVVPFMGMGGPSPSDVRERLRVEKDDKGLIQQIRSDIERLQAEALSREESLAELEKLLKIKEMLLVHTPSIWPAMGWVTSGFGFRTDPFTGLTQMHEGMDISNQEGTPVIAPADGVVSDVADDRVYGRILAISHGFGMTTRYAHLSKILVRTGEKVKRGAKIAEVGISGKTTGPHLHYEVRVNGIPVNPMGYILN
jgi:murein DD-endopeptidase MepM/ murein hydrolase activator NlpD